MSAIRDVMVWFILIGSLWKGNIDGPSPSFACISTCTMRKCIIFPLKEKKKSMGWGEAGNLSRLSSSACFDLWWARHRLTRFFYIQSRTFDSSWLFFEIFLFCLSLHISFFLPPSAAGICPLKAQGGREQGLGAGRQQELEDAKIWLLLLVGCGLMDGRGRSEHSSVCSAGAQVRRPYLQVRAKIIILSRRKEKFFSFWEKGNA